MLAPCEELGDIKLGISRPARIELINLLTELFNVLSNLEVLCSNPPPGCTKYMNFKKLKELLNLLIEAERSEED